MPLIPREQVCILLNTEEIKKPTSQPTNQTDQTKAKSASLLMSSNHFYPAGGFPVCMSIFSLLISWASHFQWQERMISLSLLSPSPSLLPTPYPISFFNFICSVFVCMEGLVFLLSQLSRPGELWLCSGVSHPWSQISFQEESGDVGGYCRFGSSDMHTCDSSGKTEVSM